MRMTNNECERLVWIMGDEPGAGRKEEEGVESNVCTIVIVVESNVRTIVM